LADITDREIKSLILHGEHFAKRSAGPNLWLRFPEGFKYPTWQFRYAIVGTEKAISLGSYRDVSLADARRLAKELRAQVALGEDPSAKRKAVIQERERSKAEMSIGELCLEYHSRRIEGRHKHDARPLGLIKRHILPAPFGNIKIGDLRASDIDNLIRAIATEKKAPTASTKVLRLLQKALDLAQRLELVPSNVARLFGQADAGGKETPRDRALSEDELRSFYKALRRARIAIESEMQLRLLLLTGCRSIELREARKEEFDLKERVWRLPKERSKNGLAIDHPLSDQSVQHLTLLIRLAGLSPYLLPAKKISVSPFPTPNALRIQLDAVRREMGDGVPHFTVHDLRRSTRTLMGKIGVAPHIAEAILNHRPKGVSGIYDRHSYFDERKEALQRLADHLDQLEDG
jgi:integrase